MPRLNPSDRAKVQVTHLIKQLLGYANCELEADLNLKQTVVRWVGQHTNQPKLVVQTTLKELVDLTSIESSSPQGKEQIREALDLLKKFLHILEDNRTKTQGAELWYFTLHLWHASTLQNLAKLEQHWEQCKSQKLNGWSNSSQKLTKVTVLPHEQPISPISDLAPLRHNLPARNYTNFIGRETQINQLLELLHPHHPAARIGISGIGGVGKTSLVLEIANRCLNSQQYDAASNPALATPGFDTIIFTSAKPHHLTSRGFLPQLQQEHTLHRICRSILQTLADPDWLEKDLTDQIQRIQTSFARQQVLLVVDNLETIEAVQDVLAFLYNLPSTVKVIITSHERAIMDVSIHLESLSEAEGSVFIQNQAQSKAISLSSAEAQTLYWATGGIPAAMVYAVGQIANGYSLADVVPRMTLAEGDFCRFCLEQSVKPLRGQPAHRLLMAIALFPKPTTRALVTQIVELPHADATAAFARLHQLSLITLQADRYTILPLTQDYALAELQAHPEFEQEARVRWVKAYLQFCQKHGHPNWKEWHDYTALDAELENIQAVIEWCIEQDKYENFAQFWNYVKGYTHLYGYGNDRLNWMNWWIESAERRSDSAALAQALRDQAWTLTLMGKAEYLAEAEQLLQQAWERCDPGDLQFQFELSLEQGILCIHQAQFATALDWLQQSKQLLPQAQLGASEQRRYSIRIDYYEAEVRCRQGNYEHAKTLFHQVFEAAHAVGWQQVEIYTLNWLAEIALEQMDLEQAEVLLGQSLPIAQQQGDKRSIGFHARSQALLEQLRGNELNTQQWLEAAIESFTDLGMDSEVQEMQNWLEMVSS